MSANVSMETETEKPVSQGDNCDIVNFPFPDPGDLDFDDDISEEERKYYQNMFKDLNDVRSSRLHCTACDRHLGCSNRSETKMRPHPMLRTLVCYTCHTFYNSGEFEKGEDGSELYCRWCGQGGQVYCCSECPHVFCAKCIKRNLGIAKIKEIESTDDWKCFKCVPRCLWDLRAVCWALLRYCDLKNKIIFDTQDPVLKEKYRKASDRDMSECCKEKKKRLSLYARKHREDKKNNDETKKSEPVEKKSTNSIISKIPSTIQVKKFASINLDEMPKAEKKATKRALSPKTKMNQIKPIAIAPYVGPMNTANLFNTPSPSQPKKMRFPNPNPVPFNSMGFNSGNNAVPFNPGKQFVPYSPRPRARPPQPMPIIHNPYNGFHNVVADNINLSLESLTQGLDMNAVAAMAENSMRNDELVCTPDFPLEPLCEVTEDNGDDDVECITPGPVAAPKPATESVLASRLKLTNISPENIIQMTDSDVTVNAVTGGLKFRVDPQTLSSNKMYRLPDGRVFAINPNASMPGGYSATIVALAENSTKVTQKGATYSAKLSAVPPKLAHPPPLKKITRGNVTRNVNILRTNTAKTKSNDTELRTRKCDLDVPIEWYRYNLIDACDSLEYSLSRLRRLKKEATTNFLRTRSVEEMHTLHKNLERILKNSSARFTEVQENLKQGMKQYLRQKRGKTTNEGDDDGEDDDVEILADNDDDPIFIDENSTDNQVDLVSSDLNDSEEKDKEKERETVNCNSEDKVSKDKDKTNDADKNEINDVEKDEHNQSAESERNEEDQTMDEDFDPLSLLETSVDDTNEENSVATQDDPENNAKKANKKTSEEKNSPKEVENQNSNSNDLDDKNHSTEINQTKSVDEVNTEDETNKETPKEIETNVGEESTKDDAETSDLGTESKDTEGKVNGSPDGMLDGDNCDATKEKETTDNQNLLEDNISQDSESKVQDTEMSDDIIESLLKDDETDTTEKPQNPISFDCDEMII